MRPGKRRALPDAEEVRLLDLVELAKRLLKKRGEAVLLVLVDS